MVVMNTISCFDLSLHGCHGYNYLLFTTKVKSITCCFAESAQLFGLEVSLKKTEVLHQPAPREPNCPPRINIGETELKSVQQFTYLGSIKNLTTDLERQTVHLAG